MASRFFFQNGLIVMANKTFTIKSFKDVSPRVKRDEEFTDEKFMVIVMEDGVDESQCGLKPSNFAKMKAPELEIVQLKVNEEKHRFKRQTGGMKAIELAVFVDEVLYNNVLDANPRDDPIDHIYEVVFTYLNAVQLLYKSDRLNTKFKVLLVRLEIFETPVRNLDKMDGDIEGYLDSFCLWQEKENPSEVFSDHWDHGLLLTGMDLYDRRPEDNNVIGNEAATFLISSKVNKTEAHFISGLAWVSGMCHPRYSCTINEGNSFESVFVIAHEMGHK